MELDTARGYKSTVKLTKRLTEQRDVAEDRRATRLKKLATQKRREERQYKDQHIELAENMRNKGES